MRIVCAMLMTMLVAVAKTPEDAPTLPVTGRVVNVSTEGQLQNAMNNLRAGDTILLANGTYSLTRSLFINGRNDVTIRGRDGSTNVVIEGKGIDNANHGGVTVGIWSNSTNTTIAHLTVRNTYDNPIIFNSGAQAPHVYNVRLIDAGSQFIKSNPTDVAAGLGVNDGVVEYCWFEYTTRPPLDHGAGVGYFNGISAHAAKNWIVRHNLFKNLHNPDGTAYPWNPAVLFWRNSSGTLTEQNTFINVDRAVAYGLDNSVPYRDHTGGVVRNNFIYLAPGFLSATRRTSADGAVIVWNSPGTQVDHNSFLLNGNVFYPIEFRFATTTNTVARNNLADGQVHLRDNAKVTMSGNVTSAQSSFFANPAAGDLHLKPAGSVIGKGQLLNTVTNDFDGDLRPNSQTTEPGADRFGLAAPEILRIHAAGTNFVLRFTTVAGASYALERTSNIASGQWVQASTNVLGTGTEIESMDPGPHLERARFYRVRGML